MEFRVLGPFEVIMDGRSLELGAPKRRAVLLALVLEPNRVVSTARLIDALWDEAPPPTAQKALQLYVSQLRRLLGRERLQTTAPGYLLRVKPDELDLARFHRLQDEGRYREALALWRGPPLTEFAEQRFAQVEIARLEESRLVCLEERIAVDLAEGHHDELVGELEALVREHPMRERLRRQLVLALYRSGRQGEALEAYRTARAVLVDELGIEPGRQLREMHQAVLNQDPALDLKALDVRPEGQEGEPIDAVQPLAIPQPPSREVRKTITVLSTVMVTSAGGRAGLDPEALRRVTRRGFAEIHAAVDSHGGSVEMTAGDAAMAIFGIPEVHEDDAVRALRAAVEIRRRLTDLAEELDAHWGAGMEVGVGVSTGEVVAGGDQLQPTGKPLAIAPRLAQAADPGVIVLDEATHRLARDVVTVKEREGALRLVEIRRGPAGHVSRFDSPMIGRERERRRLHDVFETAVADRSCQLFTVLGAAGVGKSRLVQEFLSELGDTALVARGRCLPYGEGITYWPLLEAVKEAVGLSDTDSPDEARAKLIGALAGEAGAELIGQQVAGIIGLEEVGTGPEEGFAAVRALFEDLAHVQPLTVVFDDVHWGEKTFLDLVEHLADWTRDTAMLLVCLARPELLEVRPGWGGGKLNATTALLEPLSEAESTELIQNLGGGAGLADRARHRIVQAAEGNPLFAEEMYALVTEAGGVKMEHEVPATIQALLAARLDRLDDGERSVIETASVDGQVFHEGVVTALLPETQRPLAPEHLKGLVRKELIRPDRSLFAGDRAFRFRHLLIRDAAYDSIPKEARAAMHEAYADWLEDKAGWRTAEFDEIIGYHLEQAYRYRADLGPVDASGHALARRAADRLAVAARRAFVRTDVPAAVKLILRAVSLLPPGDPARVDLVPTVRVAQALGGAELAWAFGVLDEAIGAGDDRLRAHALVQRGLLRLFTGPDVTTAELIRVAKQAIDVFEAVGDDLGLARAWRLVDQAEYHARRAGPSAEGAERALVHARRAGERYEEREIIQFLLVTLILGPQPASKAIPRCEQLLDEASGDPVLEISALGTLAYFLAIQGRSAEAQELLTRGHGLIGHVGAGFWVPPVYFALAALWQDNAVAAERDLRPGYLALAQLGEKSNLSSLAALLAQAVYDQARYDEAALLAEEARQVSLPIDVQCETIWRTVKAKVLAQRGAPERAEELAREAVGYVEQGDFLPVHAQALMDLAEILRLAGQGDAALPILDDATRLWERKGNVLAAARTRKVRASALAR
jgi:DNA-binding SARP family transcriptional activator/tetratricopeptide (TPR) repeat protein